MGVNEVVEERIALLPHQIQTDPAFDVRPWSAEHDGEEECQRIEELARSIEEVGQQDDVKVIERKNGQINYVLVTGHRRRKAVCRVNERRSQAGQPLLPLWARIDRSGEHLLRKAIASNGHRRAPSPMDIALLIQRVKKEHSWEGYKGTKMAAAFMGLEPATATQYERFLGAHPEIQNGLHAGALTVQQGLDLLAVAPAKQAEVLDKMHQRIEQRKAQVLEEVSEGPGTEEEKIARYQERVRDLKPRHPDLVAAIRDTPDAAARPIPRGRTEILDWFIEQDGPINGSVDGPVRQWLSYLVEKWASGVEAGNEATTKLNQLWDAMVGTGTAKSAEAEVVKPRKSATGRLLRCDKGRSKKPVAAKPPKPIKPAKPPKSVKPTKPAKSVKKAILPKKKVTRGK